MMKHQAAFKSHLFSDYVPPREGVLSRRLETV